MPRLLLILAIGFVLYILLRRAQSMPPHKRRGEYIKIALGASVVVVILLTLAGKMHWVGAALTGLLVAARQALPVIVRLFPLLGTLGSKSTNGQQQSTVTSAILRMHLDHENGNLSGEVLTGPYSDWRLEEMNREQLAELRDYCKDNDAESLQLLEGYLEQRFGEDYGTDPNDKADASNSPSSGISRKEALDVLGLDESADQDAIVEAHRKLMQKLHPDRGGSDYLAAKINQAKDFLLES